MAASTTIAHHVWQGNQLDVTAVQGVIADLMTRFQFGRIIFEGDRSMVSEDNWRRSAATATATSSV